MNAKVKKFYAWLVTQLKTKSWKRHVALLVVAVPLILQKFGVGGEILDLINKWMVILSGGVTDDGTIGTLLAGTIFYVYGWLKRKKV